MTKKSRSVKKVFFPNFDSATYVRENEKIINFAFEMFARTFRVEVNSSISIYNCELFEKFRNEKNGSYNSKKQGH